LNPEILANHARFEAKWINELQECTAALAGDEAFKKAYSRLVSFQAWRSELLQEVISDGSLQFSLEGQNDLLVSYLLARGGQWRSALQSLRAALENYTNSFYFMDHPVELKLWEIGSFRTQFSDVVKYMTDHPSNIGIPTAKTGIDIIKSEYATLSKAVHGSAVSFRMSSNGGPRFFDEARSNLGMWETRSKLVSRGLNLLMCSLFREHLSASRKRNLRKAITYSLKASDKSWIKETLSITLPY
jgi:hypothetical protein